MWKKITKFIKPYTQNQNPITFDNFDSYLDHIQKAISSQNLSDPKIITARATKKAIEKISASMSIVITINPAHVRQDHSKISNILCQFLIQSVEGDLRKAVWNSAINIITACDSVVDFQKWEAIIEEAFFIKYLRTTNDSKIGDTLVDQVITITNNINITTNPPKFNYWMNIISQFILPIFWGNNKCIDKKLQNSLVIPFLSFFNRNMAIPNSIPTLSSLHKNPLIPYYTMELLISAEQMLPSGKQVVFTELHAILLRFLQSTFPIKISLNQSSANIYPDIPKNAQFKDTILFLLNKQFQNSQNHAFTNQIINNSTSQNQGSTSNSNSFVLTDSIIGNQLVDFGNRNMQLILTFFNSDLTNQAAAIIKQISRSTNIFPQIILVLSTLFYRITEALFHSLIKKATASTTTTTTSKTTKSRVPIPKAQQIQQRQKQQQQYHKQRQNSQGSLNDFQQSISNDFNTSDNSDLSFEQFCSADNSSDTTASSSYQNISLADSYNLSQSNEVFSKSPSTSSFSSIDANESISQNPQVVLSPLPASSSNQISPKRHTTILKGQAPLSSNISAAISTQLSQNTPPLSNQNNQIKTMIVTNITTITTITTNLTPQIIQSYIDLFSHLLHLRPFFSACAKNIPPEKLGSTLFGPIFTCQNRFCTHQITCILFTVFFDALRYTTENLRSYCENIYSLAHSFDLNEEMQDMFNLYASIFSTICSNQLLEMNKSNDNSFVTSLPLSEEAILSNPVYYAMKSNSLNFPKIPYLFFIFPLYYNNVVSTQLQLSKDAESPTSDNSDPNKQKKAKNPFSLEFTVPMDNNMANNLASTFINGIGKYNNYMHTAKFVDVLFSIFVVAKKYNCKCSSSFIYNKTCPLLFDFFLNKDKEKSKMATKELKGTNSNVCSKPIMNALSRLFENLIMKQYVEPELAMKWLNFFFEAIKIATDSKSTYNNSEIALKALSTLMKCCCSPFLFRYSVIPFVNSHILMDYTSMYSQETIISNFLDKNSYINCALRYFSSTIEISRQIKEVHVDSIQSFPLSLQFFNEFVTDSQFRLTPYFYTSFFYAFQSQIANDDIKKLIPSTFSLLKKLITNLRSINDSDCFLNLASVIPYHYEEIKAKCPELIPLFFHQITNYSKSNQCTITSFKMIVQFVADLLIYLDPNDQLFEKSILFLLQKSESNEVKNKICNECFSFFLLKYLNNYRKKPSIESSKSPSKQKQCAIIDNKSAIITFNLYSTYITISNMYNTDNYTVEITKKDNNLTNNKNSSANLQNNQRLSYRFKDHSLGSLVQNTDMNTALLIDAFLSQKIEKHWLVFTPFGLGLAESFNDRSFMEKHIIPIVYVKSKQRKVEDILGNKFEQTSSEFVSFLTSLGENVQCKDTSFIQSIEKLIGLIKQPNQLQQQQQQQLQPKSSQQNVAQIQHQRSNSQVVGQQGQQQQRSYSLNAGQQQQQPSQQRPNSQIVSQLQQQQQQQQYPNQQKQNFAVAGQINKKLPNQPQSQPPTPQQQQSLQFQQPKPPLPQQQQQKFQQQQPQQMNQQQQRLQQQQQMNQQQQRLQQPQQMNQQQQRQQQQPNNNSNNNGLINHLESIKSFLSSAESSIYSCNCRHELLFVPYPGIRLPPSQPVVLRTTVSIIWFESPYDVINNKIINTLFIILLRPVSGGMVLVNVRCNNMIAQSLRIGGSASQQQQQQQKDGTGNVVDDYLKLNFIPFGSTVPFLVPNSILGFIIRDLVIIIDNHINNISKGNIPRPSSLNKMNSNNNAKINSKTTVNNTPNLQNFESTTKGSELTLSTLFYNEPKIAYENAWSVLDPMEPLF